MCPLVTAWHELQSVARIGLAAPFTPRWMLALAGPVTPVRASRQTIIQCTPVGGTAGIGKAGKPRPAPITHGIPLRGFGGQLPRGAGSVMPVRTMPGPVL